MTFICLGDCICVVLGCELPLVIRPAHKNRFTVVGQCYVHGIMQGEALLCLLPPPWADKVKIDSDGQYRPRHVNAETNLETRYDPRLASVPVAPEWEEIGITWNRDDPLNVVIYKNRITDEEINSDSRLLPHTFAARGIKV